MTIQLLNTPKEWKRPQRRWQCPCCKAEGWSSTGGEVPHDHDRVDGHRCVAYAKRSAKG